LALNNELSQQKELNAKCSTISYSLCMTDSDVFLLQCCISKCN